MWRKTKLGDVRDRAIDDVNPEHGEKTGERVPNYFVIP